VINVVRFISANEAEDDMRVPFTILFEDVTGAGIPDMQYNERDVLTQYIWDHCQQHMDEVERRANHVGLARIKAAQTQADGSAALAQSIASRWASFGDDEIDAALAAGLGAFRERVATRLLERAEVQAMINRCPRCGRVVRAPKAQQCLWCGFDWHDRES
jgi:hypothetical protein